MKNRMVDPLKTAHTALNRAVSWFTKDDRSDHAHRLLAAIQAMSAAYAGAAAEHEVTTAEEKSGFTVVLANTGVNKIIVIKEIRALTGLGLREAKDLVEATPKVVMEGVNRDAAKRFRDRLTAAGATVELR